MNLAEYLSENRELFEGSYELHGGYIINTEELSKIKTDLLALEDFEQVTELNFITDSSNAHAKMYRPLKLKGIVNLKQISLTPKMVSGSDDAAISVRGIVLYIDDTNAEYLEIDNTKSVEKNYFLVND